MHANQPLTWVLERVSHLRWGLPCRFCGGKDSKWRKVGVGVARHNCVTPRALHRFLLRKHSPSDHCQNKVGEVLSPKL